MNHITVQQPNQAEDIAVDFQLPTLSDQGSFQLTLTAGPAAKVHIAWRPTNRPSCSTQERAEGLRSTYAASAGKLAQAPHRMASID